MSNENLELAVNHAVSQARNLVARYGLTDMHHGLDQKRGQAWCEYGYPETVTSGMLYKLYRRGGLAHGAVNKLVGNCWKTNPEVIDGTAEDSSLSDSAWDKAAEKVFKQKFWAAFAEADKRRLVTRYSALILRVKDSAKVNEPVTRSAEIEEVMPVWGTAIRPFKVDENPNSEQFGQVTMWEYDQVSPGGMITRLKIHPDRVVILGDRSIDAIGYLEPSYNNFVSLEKVEGGSGESFLKNASRQMNIDFDKELNFRSLADMYGVSVNELQERFNEVARDFNTANDMALITQGARVTPMVAAVPDPTPTFNINASAAAAGLDMPVKVLVGMQTGERASTEDWKQFNSACMSRRQNQLTLDILDLVNHLVRIKVLKPSANISVIWDDLNEASREDKLIAAGKMSEINQRSLGVSDSEFTMSEIRVMAGFPADKPVEQVGKPLPEIE